MLPFCAVILLATFWALISMVALWRRPVYTFADWQLASERICHAIHRLKSPLSDKRTCNTLLEYGRRRRSQNIPHGSAYLLL